MIVPTASEQSMKPPVQSVISASTRLLRSRFFFFSKSLTTIANCAKLFLTNVDISGSALQRHKFTDDPIYESLHSSQRQECRKMQNGLRVCLVRSHLCRTSLKSGRLSWPAEPTATFTRVGSSLIYAHGQKESDVQREPTEELAKLKHFTD